MSATLLHGTGGTHELVTLLTEEIQQSIVFCTETESYRTAGREGGERMAGGREGWGEGKEGMEGGRVGGRGKDGGREGGVGRGKRREWVEGEDMKGLSELKESKTKLSVYTCATTCLYKQ